MSASSYPSCESKVISATRRDFGESRISESALDNDNDIRALSHGPPTAHHLQPDEQLFPGRNRAVLFRDVIAIAMIRPERERASARETRAE